jgi:hypothetical protein
LVKQDYLFISKKANGIIYFFIISDSFNSSSVSGNLRPFVSDIKKIVSNEDTTENIANIKNLAGYQCSSLLINKKVVYIESAKMYG